MEILLAFLPFAIMLVVYGGLSLAGTIIERNHEANLARREAAIGHFPLFDTRTPPPGMAPVDGELVTGNVVIGTGYLKQFLASLRTLVGGEVRGYQRVLDRGRREAQLRMIEDARARNATAIINVRFETSDVGGMKPFAEIFCYGTLVR